MIVSRPKHSLRSKENYDFHYAPDKTSELSTIANLHSFVTVNKATWSKLLAVLSVRLPNGKNVSRDDKRK